MPATPSYIVMDSHPFILKSTIFNLSLGRIKLPNAIVDGTVFTNIGSKKYNTLLRY